MVLETRHVNFVLQGLKITGALSFPTLPPPFDTTCCKKWGVICRQH
jgi:hypothetical protein